MQVTPLLKQARKEDIYVFAVDQNWREDSVEDVAQEALCAERCTGKKVSFFIKPMMCEEFFSTLTWQCLGIIYKVTKFSNATLNFLLLFKCSALDTIIFSEYDFYPWIFCAKVQSSLFNKGKLGCPDLLIHWSTKHTWVQPSPHLFWLFDIEKLTENFHATSSSSLK